LGPIQRTKQAQVYAYRDDDRFRIHPGVPPEIFLKPCVADGNDAVAGGKDLPLREGVRVAEENMSSHDAGEGVSMEGGYQPTCQPPPDYRVHEIRSLTVYDTACFKRMGTEPSRQSSEKIEV